MKKKIDYRLNFIDIVLLLCLIVCLCLIFQGLFAFIDANFVFCIFCIIPLFILLILKFTSSKLKRFRYFFNITAAIFFVIFVFYWLLIEYFAHIQYSPSKINYSNSVNTLKKREGAERLSHFPKKIPQNAKNYFMQIESSFDGYDMNYLSFETDKAYVNRMFNNYEKNCKILGSYRELTDKGIIIYINSLDDNDKICILKNEGYTSGLIFAQTGSKIYFFYSNY